MNDDDRSLSGLIQEMLDGALDDDQRTDLLNRVEADDAARKLYLDQIATHTALQATLADCLPSSVAKPNGADDATPADFASTSRWPAVAAIASLAAGIILLVGGIVYLRSQNSPIVQSVETPHVAVITQAVGAYDSEGVLFVRASK